MDGASLGLRPKDIFPDLAASFICLLLSGFIRNTNSFMCPLMLIPFYSYAIFSLSRSLDRADIHSCHPFIRGRLQRSVCFHSLPFSPPDSISLASQLFTLCRPFPTEEDHEICRMINLPFSPSRAIPAVKRVPMKHSSEIERSLTPPNLPLQCYSFCHPFMVTLCFR